MSAAEWVAIKWATLECGNSGINFQVPDSFDRERREGGGDWYCPNGHCRVYRTREVDRLKEHLESARESERWYQRRLESEQNSHRATKGHLTRVKRRASAGTCPCCKRTFKQLARHMKTKHPDYAKTDDPAGGQLTGGPK